MRIVLHTMELRWICQVLLLLSASWTTVNSLECYGCEGDAECDQSPISCSGPDAYCQTSVLEASVFFLTALNIKKTCAYGERPDKVTQITAKRKVSLSLQENYCNTNFCNNETDFEPALAEPNNLHCYGALCQGRQCASSTPMDNLICLGNQTKCVELAISGKMGITSDVSMKGCAEIPECEEEMGFRSTHASFHMQCCDSDFCNGGTGPTEDDLVPNGVECYSCSEGDEKIGCPLERATTVNCTGSMTSCLEAFGVTRESDVVSSRVIRGCAAPKTCNGSFLSLLHQFQEPQVFCCSGNLCNSRTFVGVQNTSHGVSNKPSSDGHSEHSSHVTYNADIFSAANTANGSGVGTTSLEGKSNLTLSDNENILNSQSNMSIANYYEDSTTNMDSGTNSELTQLEYQQDSGYDPQSQTDIQKTDDLILSHLGMPLNDLDLNVSVSNMSSDLYQSGVDEGGYSTGGSASVFQSLKPSESNNSNFSNSSTGFLSGPPDIAISSDNGSTSISGVSPGNKNNSVYDSSSVYHTGVNDTVLSSNDYNSAPNSGMALGGSNDLNSKNLSTVSPFASSTASLVASAFSNTVSGSPNSDISELLTGGTNGSASFNSSMDYHNSSDHIGLSGSTSPSVIPPGVTNNSISPSSTALYSGSDHTDVPTGNSSMYSTSSDGHDVTTHTPILSAGDSSSAPLAGIYSGIHDVSLSSSISTVYHNVTEHTTPSPGNHSTASFSAMSEDSHNVSGSKSYAVFYNNGSSPRDHGTDTHSSTYHSGNIAAGNLLDSNNSTTITPMSSTFSTLLSGNQTGLSAISSGVNDGSGVINSSMVHYNTSNHTRHDSAASHALMSSGDPNDLIYNTSATHYYSGTDINIGNDSIASSPLSNLSATSYGESGQTTSPSSNHLIDITVPETILSYPHSSHGGFASTSPPTSSEISTSHLGMSAGGTNDSTYNISSSDYNYSVMPPGGHHDVISNTSSAIYDSDSEHAGLTYGDYKNDSLSGMPSVGHNDYLPNVSSIIYHSGSEHAGLSTGEHSNGSLTGMPSVGHNDTISNTSSTMYHSDSEHAYGDFKNDSVSGMPSRAHNDLLSNTSSPIYHSGSEHTGLYTVDHSNGSLPEVPPGAGNDSVSDVIAATGVSTGARSNDSLSVTPPGSHNNSISDIYSAIYHSDSAHTDLPSGDYNKNYSVSGMPSEGQNAPLSNISSNIGASSVDYNKESLSEMPPEGHNDSFSNDPSAIYHSGSEHAGLSTREHSNGSLTGMPSVRNNDTISNTSSNMYHSDSEHAYGDFKNDSVSGMPSRGHNDLLSNTSSPIYHSGSEHTGLYTVDHSNGSLPEVPPGAGNDSVSDVIAATGASTGARSNDSLSVAPPGSHNNSISDIYSAIYHSESEHTDLPSGDYKNYSVSGMPSEGQNAPLSNISSNIGASSVDYNKESLSGMPPEGHNDSFSNDSSAIYHSDSEHTGLSTVNHNNSSALDIPPGGHNEPLSNISSNLSHSGSGHTYGSLSGMPPGGQNGSISNASTDSYHSDSEHNGLLTSDHSNGSLSGMTSVGHNASDSNTSSIIYHSGSEHAGVTDVDYKNDSLSGMPTDRHNNSHFNISSDLEHIGLHSGDYKNDSFSGITSEDHNYLLSNMSSNSSLSSADYNSDSPSTMLSEGLNDSLSNMSSNSGLSPGGYNSDSFLGMPPGGHNDSLSNISSTMYYTGSEHNGLSTVHNNNDSLSGVPSEEHNDSLTNASSNIYHSGSELTGTSNTDHSNGSLPGISLGGHNNSASNNSTLYHSTEYYNFSISGLSSALHTGAFPRNSSSNSSLPVSHGNPNHTNMTSGHSSVSHSELTSTSSNGSPLGYHTGGNHTDISPGGNESSGSNMSASSLGASSDSFLNRNASTMNTNEPHHESSSGIFSTDDPGNISMHNVSDETVSSSFFDSAVNSDIHYRGDPNGTSASMEGETGNNINTTSSHPARTINTYVFLVVVIWGLMY